MKEASDDDNPIVKTLLSFKLSVGRSFLCEKKEHKNVDQILTHNLKM